MSHKSQSQPVARWPLRWPMVLPLSVVAVSLAVLWLTTPMRERMVANQLAEQLTDADPPRIRATLQALAELDEAGLAALVRLLDSTDPAVAVAAKQTLDQQMEAWRVRGASYWSPRVEVLAKSLADHTEQFQPAARQQAAVYAAELLQWPTADDVVDRVDVLIACDHVLHAANSARMVAVETTATGVTTTDSMNATVVAPSKTGTMDEQIERFASLPGGGLPIDVTAIPDLPSRSRVRSASSPSPSPPRTLKSRNEVLPIEQDAGRAVPKSGQDSSSDRRAESRSLRWRDTRQVAARLVEAEEDTPALRSVNSRGTAGSDGSDSDRESVMSLDVPDVIAQLDENEHEAETVTAAEHELIRRGFNSRELELARRLATSDAKTRREMVAALPYLPGIDTRAWLLWLTEDSDADVRLSAYRWLVTTGDVVTIKRIRRAAREDVDLRIRRLANEMSGNRRQLR